MIKRFLQFIWAFISRPRTTGAIMPSSEGLSREMMDGIEWDKASAIVEYGPGTGVFTKHILRKIEESGRDIRFFAVEIDKRLAQQLRKEYPSVTIYADSVENIKQLCSQEGIEQIDVVISSLPWSIFSEKLQDDLMTATLSILKPGGQFVTFSYLSAVFLPAGKRFRSFLVHHFRLVGVSQTVWMNLPPAFVYRCKTALGK